jgi:predicted ATPase
MLACPKGTKAMPSTSNGEGTPEITAQSKPPFLRRVRIRGYKSIAFRDVTLEPLTILVGRNASGKSNFLDALAFLRDLMEVRVTGAVHNRKGWRAIHCRTSPTPLIEMGVEGTFDAFKSTWGADYFFSLEAAGQNQIQVRQESLSSTDAVFEGPPWAVAWELN